MSKFTTADDELEDRIDRGVVVQEAHPDDISMLEYLAHHSDADPFELTEDNQ